MPMPGDGQPGQGPASVEQKQAIRNTPSAAELASADAEGYAEPGLAEHKSAGGKHLDEYWHRGSAGLRPEGHDVQEEEQRLHELEEHTAPGIVQRVKDTVASTVQAAKEMTGLTEPKK